MAPAPVPAAPSWKVVGQNQATEIQPGGTPVRGVRVYYATGAGQAGSVFVAESQYTPGNVAAAVAEAAAQMDAVASLTSG